MAVVAAAPDEGLDFIAVARTLWRHRRVVAASWVVCTLAALSYALLATPIYKAQVVLTPTPKDTESGNGEGIAGELGGLASLAGVSLAAGTPEEQASQAVLESDHLIDEFIRRYDLRTVLSPNPQHPLSQWRATQLFKKQVVVVTKDQRKGVTLVTLEWKDGATVARWANDFVALANELMRNRVIDESTRTIAYLNTQLAKTTDVDLRRILYGIIESETKKLTLANGRIEYAYQIDDPALTPEVRAHPRRTLIVLLGGAGGLVVGFLIAFILERVAEHRLRSGPA